MHTSNSCGAWFDTMIHTLNPAWMRIHVNSRKKHVELVADHGCNMWTTSSEMLQSPKQRVTKSIPNLSYIDLPLFCLSKKLQRFLVSSPRSLAVILQGHLRRLQVAQDLSTFAAPEALVHHQGDPRPAEGMAAGRPLWGEMTRGSLKPNVY